MMRSTVTRCGLQAGANKGCIIGNHPRGFVQMGALLKAFLVAGVHMGFLEGSSCRLCSKLSCRGQVF